MGKWANYNSPTLEFLLNVTGLQSANESSKEADLTPDDSNRIRKRARSPLPTDASRNNNNDNNKSMKDSMRHKNKDRPKRELPSLTDFTNDEIRLLHRHKRDDTSSKSLAALAQRWDRFARDYEKTWRGGEPYFEEELEKEEEEEEEEEEKEKEEEEEEEEEEKEGGVTNG